MLVASQASQMLEADAVSLATSSSVKIFWLDLIRTIMPPRNFLDAKNSLTAGNFTCNSCSVPIAWDFQFGTHSKLFCLP